jgi:NTP pyrophosphatase (non-canonical NTP hydrolase)
MTPSTVLHPERISLAFTELGEAFDAYRKNPAGLGAELADAFMFLVSLAEMNGIDLDSAVEAKMATNAARTYRRLDNGTLVKVDGGPDQDAPK